MINVIKILKEQEINYLFLGQVQFETPPNWTKYWKSNILKNKNLDQTKLSKNMNQMEPKWVKSVQF